jgi:hypothetical protein
MGNKGKTVGLSAYIHDCVADAETETPLKVVLDEALLPDLRNLRGQSESKVLEHGHNLFWKEGKLVLGPRMVGEATRISLDTEKALKAGGYIGDLHSHPYKQKMGKSARIGPSTGDLDEWYKWKPKDFTIGVHLVMSSASVFLVVTRNVSKLDYSSAKSDTVRLNEYALTIPELAEALGNAQKMDAKKRWAFEKACWESMAPEAAKQFAEDNYAMNIAVAKKSKHEYYYVEDIEKSREMLRKSNEVK